MQRYILTRNHRLLVRLGQGEFLDRLNLLIQPNYSRTFGVAMALLNFLEALQLDTHKYLGNKMRKMLRKPLGTYLPTYSQAIFI